MPLTPDPATTPSKAGITTTADGQRVIPASVRSDGTTRKEIRVRPGYRPPEDVEVYKNRTAEAWKTRGSGGVPGAAPVTDETKKPESANKNAKRRAARKKAKEKEDGETEDKKPAETIPSPTLPASSPKAKEELTEEEKDKRAKAIRKKIRQANDLKSKRENGENLLPEQLDKIIKMNELLRQLNALGFKE